MYNQANVHSTNIQIWKFFTDSLYDIEFTRQKLLSFLIVQISAFCLLKITIRWLQEKTSFSLYIIFRLEKFELTYLKILLFFWSVSSWTNMFNVALFLNVSEKIVFQIFGFLIRGLKRISHIDIRTYWNIISEITWPQHIQSPTICIIPRFSLKSIAFQKNIWSL